MRDFPFAGIPPFICPVSSQDGNAPLAENRLAKWGTFSPSGDEKSEAPVCRIGGKSKEIRAREGFIVSFKNRMRGHLHM
jgi:hypothetical protein